MREEVERATALYGVGDFRRECLVPADASGCPPSLPPEYEMFGERRRAAGLYAEVVRYHEHFEPAARAVRDAIRTCTLASRS